MTEDKVKLTIRLPATLHQMLKERAVEYNISLNQVIGGHMDGRTTARGL